MSQRHPSLLLSSCNAFNAISFCPTHCSSTPLLSRIPDWPSRNRPSRNRLRPYATVRSDEPQPENTGTHRPSTEESELTWPRVAHPRIPTPYQILNCHPRATYTKHHFYRLVKLYHPDRHSPSTSSVHNLPQHTRLERYRLIVTAHTILSDPSKRRLYDHFGTGWAGRPDASASVSFGMNRAPPQWPLGQNPMFNATWEDWERWYQTQREQAERESSGADGDGDGDGGGGKGKRDMPAQRTLLMNNYAFVSLIVMLAALGGVGQATRAQQYGVSYVEQRKEANDRTHADLMTVRGHAAGSSREQKVERFLKARDGAAYADEGTRRMLLEPDICESGRMEDGRGSYGTASRRAG